MQRYGIQEIFELKKHLQAYLALLMKVNEIAKENFEGEQVSSDVHKIQMEVLPEVEGL